MDVIPHSSEPSDSQILQKMQQVGIIYTPYSHLYEGKDWSTKLSSWLTLSIPIISYTIWLWLT